MAAPSVRLSFECISFDRLSTDEDPGKTLPGTIIRPSLEGKRVYHEDPITSKTLQVDDNQYLSVSMHEYTPATVRHDGFHYRVESKEDIKSNPSKTLQVDDNHYLSVSMHEYTPAIVRHDGYHYRVESKEEIKSNPSKTLSLSHKQQLNEDVYSKVNQDKDESSLSNEAILTTMKLDVNNTLDASSNATSIDRREENRKPTITYIEAPPVSHAVITSFCKNNNEIWVYNIDVQSEAGPLSTYTIRRRFSDFKRLHGAIVSTSPEEPIPSLPESGFISKLRLLISDNTLYHRKLSFQSLLDAIYKSPSLRKHPAYLQFIGEAPASGNAGYVSLDQYGTPSVKLTTQVTATQLRKRASSEPLRLRPVRPTTRRSNTLGV